MTKGHIEFVLSGYGVPYTDALADKLLEMFDEEAASYLHTINELNKALSIKNKGEWIPISERLPEKNVWVLVTVEQSGMRYQEIMRRNNYIEGWTDNIDNYTDEITAWQPLPEPYKAESEVKPNE